MEGEIEMHKTSTGTETQRERSDHAAKKRRSLTDNRIVKYLKETRAELSKVIWPTRREALKLSLIVMAVTFVMAAFLGVVDYACARLIGLILR
jgi:preprotein translocase subunit SecE